MSSNQCAMGWCLKISKSPSWWRDGPDCLRLLKTQNALAPLMSQQEERSNCPHNNFLLAWVFRLYQSRLYQSLRENKRNLNQHHSGRALGAVLTFSPCRAGTESRRLWKLSLMWSLRLRSSALWCARLSACNNKSHRAFSLAAQQRRWDGACPSVSAQSALLPLQDKRPEIFQTHPCLNKVNSSGAKTKAARVNLLVIQCLTSQSKQKPFHICSLFSPFIPQSINHLIPLLCFLHTNTVIYTNLSFF